MTFGTDFIVGCVCSSIALLILCVRLGSTVYLQRIFDLTCALVATSILLLAARAVVNGFYDVYGTASQMTSSHEASTLTAEQLLRIKTGTILNLVARLLVTSFYWSQIALLLLFYSKLFRDVEKIWNRIIACTWAVFGVTYLACVLATFLECRPFHRYWQISPSPGQCVKAYGQLYLQGVSNIILDILILIISYRVIVIKHRTQKQRVRIIFICCLGIFCIVVTSIRLAIIKGSHSSTAVRSIWASIQAMVSAAVANLPTIYGNLMLYKRKNLGSQGQQSMRAGSYIDLRSPSDITIHRKSSIPLQEIENSDEKV